MSLSDDARYYMGKREVLKDDEVIFVDEVFVHLYNLGSTCGVNLAKDDRAAELEAALIKFILESRE